MALPSYLYFKYPFAVGGQKLPGGIPQTTTGDGSVSYQEGWGGDYSLPLTEPGALPVPRLGFNQFFYDISEAVQSIQQWGVPVFITTAQNGGSAFPYSKYAFAAYDDGVNGPRVFQSTIDNNTGVPSAGTSPFTTTGWRWMDFNANKMIYDNVAFATGVSDGDCVFYNPSASPSAGYDLALANPTLAKAGMIGIADTTYGRVYATGSLCSLFSGLTIGSTYYLSSTSAGDVTLTPSPVVVGVAVSATTILLNITPSVVNTIPFIFKAALTANQTISNNVGGIVGFDNVNPAASAPFTGVLFDPAGKFDTVGHFYQPTQAGYYRVSAMLSVSQSGSGTFTIGMGKNLSVSSNVVTGTVTSSFGFATPNALQTICLSDIVYLNGSTDKLMVFALTTGSNLVVNFTSGNGGGSVPGSTFTAELIS